MGTGDYIREEVRDEIKYLRWRLGQVEQERDDYRALWEKEKLEHQKTRERMAQSMDEAHANGYKEGPSLV